MKVQVLLEAWGILFALAVAYEFFNSVSEDGKFSGKTVKKTGIILGIGASFLWIYLQLR